MAFNIRASIVDENGDYDEEAAGRYQDELLEVFEASPEFQALIDAGNDVGWLPLMLEYGFGYIGKTPAKYNANDLEEIVFELFPQKVSTPAESGPAIVREMRAFWQFVKREYGLRNADQCLRVLGPDAEARLTSKLADPRNYGMAKSFVMQGQARGFDISSQEGLDQWLLTHQKETLQKMSPSKGGWLGKLFSSTKPDSANESIEGEEESEAEDENWLGLRPSDYPPFDSYEPRRAPSSDPKKKAKRKAVQKSRRANRKKKK